MPQFFPSPSITAGNALANLRACGVCTENETRLREDR